MATSETDIAAQLIERLLGDPAFRAEFRRDPATACRNAGLDQLADEMSLGAGKAMMTLENRESKSSLAGVMMAAAMEGVSVYQFGEHVMPHIEDVPGVVGDVLSKVNLPAISAPLDLKGALAGSPPASEPPPAPANGDGAADAANGGAGGGAAGAGGAAEAGAAPPPPPPPPAAPVDAEKVAAAAKEAAEAKNGGAAKEPEPDPAKEAADKIAAAEDPKTKQAEEVNEAVSKIQDDAKDIPETSDMPDADAVITPAKAEDVAPGGSDTPEPPPAAQEPAAPAEQPAPPAAPPVEPAGGGGGDAAAKALLENKNLVLDADAQKDIGGGDVDPRMIALLDKLTDKHKIELSVIKTGHDQFTSGGSVSNHFVGRGIDIARVDGEIVNSGSPAARELASEIANITGDLRPTEVGTPFQIGAEGFFTDGAHQDHLHVAFDGEPPAGFQAPAPAATAAAAPGQPAAAEVAEPKVKPGDSGRFMAVKAESAAAKPKASDSGSFMAVKEAKPAPAAAAQAPAPDPAAGVAGDFSGVADAYPGDDASKEEFAAWMAKQAQARGLPPELPVMASLVESGLTNIQGGDADSVGFFQMRVGIWNQGEYAGYPDKPELQVKWFLDQAEAVKDARVAAGKPIDDPNSFGEWIADVERPAEQYRGRYQLQLDEAQGLLKNAPAGQAPAGSAVPAPTAEPQAGAPAAVEPAAGGGGEDAAAKALLENKNLVLDADAQKDIGGGDVDPRMIALLDKLTDKHKIELSVIKTGHDQFTSGGSVSNHFVGRGIDIARVDGEIVNAGSPAARELASEIANMTGDLRPTEVGTPFQIGAEGFFTDGAHQDHLHVAFDGEPPPSFQAPAPAAPAAAAAVAPGQPAAVAAAAEPKPKPGDSGAFMSVKAEDAGKAADAPLDVADSGAFRAVQPPAGPASAVAAPGTAPAVVADAATATASGSSGLGASALEVAKQELAKGVKETGVNTGADVNKYLASAGVAPGNPWCASFVTWSLEQSGRKMEGGGWAAVQTWVRAAEAGTNGLSVVSPEDARPGDIVTYDWGGQEDFASDGHIGFLASKVEGDKFTALEGNYQDAVLSVPRQMGDANVKFLRISGEASADAPKPTGTPLVGPTAQGPVQEGSDVAAPSGSNAATTPPADSAAGTAADAATPAQPAPAAGAAAAQPPAAAAPVDPAAVAKAEAAAARDAAEARRGDSGQFMSVKAEEAAKKHHSTVKFMKAIDPKTAKAADAPAAPAAAAATPAAAAPSDQDMVQQPGDAVPSNELALADVGPIGDYPGDRASQAELAAWLSNEAKKAGLPPELPVMASLVESDIKNVKGGDADSAGFFQMRVGIWDKVADYKGYRQDPNLQAKWFIDQALAVKRSRIAAGDANFGKDPGSWGNWIADVERPAAQYRGRYQLRLDEARRLLR